MTRDSVTLGEALGSRLRAGRDIVVDALLPPRCLGCHAAVAHHGQLCAECWRALDFIEGPQCAACGLPFEFDLGSGAVCGACARARPAYAGARAVLRYDEHSRDLILGFKHADRTELAPTLAGWMARAGAALIEEADIVAPVPLHRLRLLRRRYNQAALLANAIADVGAVAALPDLLVRRRATPSQAGLSPAGRVANVRGAFGVNRARRARGQRVLLIDDVMTTGTTVASCARALLRARVAEVKVLTLARVVRPTIETI